MAATNKKLTAAAALASLLLAAFITATSAADASTEAPQAGGSGGGAATKEASKFCSATDYKETCEKSLEKAKGSEPKDLIKATFDASVAELKTVIKNSAAYKTVKEDPMTGKALEVCEEVLNNAIGDLKRSVQKVNKIDGGKLNDNIADLRNWLSATIAHKETCIDSFENTTGTSFIILYAFIFRDSDLLHNGATSSSNDCHLFIKNS